MNIFDTIRKEIHDSMLGELKTRAKGQDGLKPTEEELRLGVFNEQLEPPVRNAVKVISRKGYPTRYSGFDDQDPSRQILVVDTDLPKETVIELRKRGVKVKPEPAGVGRPDSTRIEFKPKRPSVSLITAIWDEVAEVLPDTGKGPATSREGENFRRIYTKHR